VIHAAEGGGVGDRGFRLVLVPFDRPKGQARREGGIGILAGAEDLEPVSRDVRGGVTATLFT
jgi:hypothetical protein